MEHAIINQTEEIERLAAKEDILGDTHVGDEVWFLENDRNAACLRLARIAERNRPTFEDNLTVIGWKDSGENVHQR